MNEHETLAERIDALETRLTFQERTIDELNDVVTKQWRQIDALSRLVDQLRDHARATSPIADPRTEPPPPHY